MAEQNYTIADLCYLMARLRDPVDGCPWDREQSFASIVPYTLEECYELADAIDREDMPHIKEELGDVLFQVIFYAQLAVEQQQFDFESVVSQLTAKLIRRHPHVFPTGELHSRTGQSIAEVANVKASWEAIKSAERGAKQQLSILDDVPVTIPAMARGIKLQKRAARLGFDWPSIEPVFAKFDEEMAELKEAWRSGDIDAIKDEFGDLLFCCANLARYLKVDPETALRSTNHKFERRFRYVEQQLMSQGLSGDQASLELMDDLWDQAKALGL